MAKRIDLPNRALSGTQWLPKIKVRISIDFPNYRNKTKTVTKLSLNSLPKNTNMA